MDKNGFGKQLSEKVFEYLVRNKQIDHSHYGYCGVGFVMDGMDIHYTHFDELLTYRQKTKYVSGGKYLGIIKTFYSKTEFVDWLSEQSDYSLSSFETGDQWYIGNQRITQKRFIYLLENEKF